MITMNNVKTAVDGKAWKTATMRGYIRKTVLDEAAHGKNAFKLTFINIDGEMFDFFFDNGTGVSSNSLILDTELLSLFLEPQWVSGNASDFENVRVNKGEW